MCVCHEDGLLDWIKRECWIAWLKISLDEILFAHFHTTIETGSIPSHFSKKISESLARLYFRKTAWNIDQKLCTHRIIVIDISAQTNLFRVWFVWNRSAIFDYKWNVFSFSIFSEFYSSLMSTFRENRITSIILIMNIFALTHLISKQIYWDRTNQQIGFLFILLDTLNNSIDWMECDLDLFTFLGMCINLIKVHFDRCNKYFNKNTTCYYSSALLRFD